ncbi:hypothetical protein Pint_23490 [Pistacia integerrima]|uniref:Uncharacterized protein n=1 Tax=Pistacia integerrima TaxID=434235 RepID=A0ACC0YK70_9ROSI|nr:hypothetical protein Pint_23490 [Pistacia integerrima]
MAAIVYLVLFFAMTGHSSALYCLCKDGVGDSALQKAIDYACGAGADCTPIIQNGVCYNPNTVKDHCNYAVNSYFQKKGQTTGSCDFAGAAATSANPPSNVASTCVYPSTARYGLSFLLVSVILKSFITSYLSYLGLTSVIPSQYYNSTLNLIDFLGFGSLFLPSSTGTGNGSTPTTTPSTTPSTTPTTTTPTTTPSTSTTPSTTTGTPNVFGGTTGSLGPTGSGITDSSAGPRFSTTTHFFFSMAVASSLALLWG